MVKAVVTASAWILTILLLWMVAYSVRDWRARTQVARAIAEETGVQMAWPEGYFIDSRVMQQFGGLNIDVTTVWESGEGGVGTLVYSAELRPLLPATPDALQGTVAACRFSLLLRGANGSVVGSAPLNPRVADGVAPKEVKLETIGEIPMTDIAYANMMGLVAGGNGNVRGATHIAIHCLVPATGTPTHPGG